MPHKIGTAVFRELRIKRYHSLGELFMYFSVEMSDITWMQPFQMLLQMFRTILTNNRELSEEKTNKLMDAHIPL